MSLRCPLAIIWFSVQRGKSQSNVETLEVYIVYKRRLYYYLFIPVNKTRRPNINLLLDQCHWYWSSIRLRVNVAWLLALHLKQLTKIKTKEFRCILMQPYVAATSALWRHVCDEE